MFSVSVKLALWKLICHVDVPGSSPSSSLYQLPVNTHPGRQGMMTQVLRTLPHTWGLQLCPQLLISIGPNSGVAGIWGVSHRTEELLSISVSILQFQIN